MIDPAAGILLIAEPFLKDPNFLRTVVFLCSHNQEDGSFGFVLNRRYENTLDELLPDLQNHRLPVYYGGPVQPETIHFLHQYPVEIPGGQEVMEGIWWGGDFDSVIDLLKSGKIDPLKIRFFIGYSGWSQGQLEDEITQKTWLTVEANEELVFQEEHQHIWKAALHELGDDYALLSNFPIDPQLN